MYPSHELVLVALASEKLRPSFPPGGNLIFVYTYHGHPRASSHTYLLKQYVSKYMWLIYFQDQVAQALHGHAACLAQAISFGSAWNFRSPFLPILM